MTKIAKATKDKFTPLHVYKALLKISLSLIKTDEVESLRSAFEFLISEAETVKLSILMCLFTKMVEILFNNPKLFSQ